MKKTINIAICWAALLLMFTYQRASAQQDPMYTQYMFNGLILNPAYAGTHESVSLTSLTRMQWISVPGAPFTQTFSGHTPIGRNVSVGANFVHDRIGSTTRNMFSGAYAYAVPFYGVGTISFGLQGSLMSYRTDELFARDPNDPMNDAVGSQMNPNFGAGVYFHNDKLFVGFSAPNILRHDFELEGDRPMEFTSFNSHYFAYAGYVFTLNENLKLKPNVLMKYVHNAPMQFDFNANFLLNEILWIGGSYRTLDGFSILSEIQLKDPNLRIGYAFDFPHTELRRQQWGTHEIMLNYRFSFDKTTTLNPRYF